jgi:ABC-type antimicrobial peptide transport system permease subunit
VRRFINILGYSLIAMLRHWRSTVGLILVYSFIVFAFGSVLFFIEALLYESEIVIKWTPEIWVQRIMGGRLVPIDESMIKQIKGIRGVREVEARIWGYYYDSITGGVFTIIGSDSLPRYLKYVSGDTTMLSRSMPVVACGTGYLEAYSSGLGREIVLLDTGQNMVTLKVAMVFSSESDLLTRDLIVVPKEIARQLLGITHGYATDIAVYVSNSDEVRTVAQKISRRFKSTRVVTRNDLRSTYRSLFGYRGSLFIFGLSMSLMAFLILAWVKASGFSSKERRELGIQKAVGWGISDVLIQRFWEGVVVSVNSTLLGLIAAYIHVFFLDAPVLKPFLVGWSVIYPSFHLLRHVEASSVLLVFFLSVLPYTAATIVPAWRAAVADPSEVINAI